MSRENIITDGEENGLKISIADLFPGEDLEGSIIFDIRYRMISSIDPDALASDDLGEEEGFTDADLTEIEIEKVTVFDSDGDPVEVPDTTSVDLPIGSSGEVRSIERSILVDRLKKAIIDSIRRNIDGVGNLFPLS